MDPTQSTSNKRVRKALPKTAEQKVAAKLYGREMRAHEAIKPTFAAEDNWDLLPAKIKKRLKKKAGKRIEAAFRNQDGSRRDIPGAATGRSITKALAKEFLEKDDDDDDDSEDSEHDELDDDENEDEDGGVLLDFNDKAKALRWMQSCVDDALQPATAVAQELAAADPAAGGGVTDQKRLVELAIEKMVQANKLLKKLVFPEVNDEDEDEDYEVGWVKHQVGWAKNEFKSTDDRLTWMKDNVDDTLVASNKVLTQLSASADDDVVKTTIGHVRLAATILSRVSGI